MKNITIASVCALLSLGACSHYNEDLSALGKKMDGQQYAGASAPQDIAPAAGAASGQTLNAALAGEYYTMARYENDKAYDYKAAKMFTKKAKMASNGKLVVPGKVSSFDIPEKWQPELNRARGELISALKTQNTPENASALGTAQARYECWLERAEEAADEAHYQSCKSEFEAAMAQLVMPAAGSAEATTAYDINFAGQSAVLDQHSKSIVQYLANYLNSGANGTYNVNLTGFMTGAEGSPEQNVVNARVIAVRDELIRSGVAAARVNPMISASAPAEMAGKVQALLVPTQPHENVRTTTEYVPLPQPVPVPATGGR
jgi:OOP family OmpA-OmpF porin